ncbi:MAG: hypothetical protein HQK50_17385 [Oligoflexia bacterium]|nr:hypothetical protein [Oligoflexia bacterium]MBF0367352.1 hypothetical protein [Oligoflexia bacterium]
MMKMSRFFNFNLLLRKIALAVAAMVISNDGVAMNERVVRSIFSGELLKESLIKENPMPNEYKWHVSTPTYHFDLNSDSKEESFIIEKKDGEDWFYVTDNFHNKLLAERLERRGHESFVYRIRGVRISSKTRLFLVYYYQGYHQFINFHATSILYFLTIDDNDLHSLKMVKGPTIWDEYNQKGQHLGQHYHQRYFDVTISDLNHDGVSEVILEVQKLSHVFVYLGNGKWQE